MLQLKIFSQDVINIVPNLYCYLNCIPSFKYREVSTKMAHGFSPSRKGLTTEVLWKSCQPLNGRFKWLYDLSVPRPAWIAVSYIANIYPLVYNNIYILPCRKTCLSKSKGRPKPPVQEETYRKLYRSLGSEFFLSLHFLFRFFASHNEIFFSLVQKLEFDWTYKIKETGKNKEVT